jgi:hypothetical protein
MTNDDAKVTGSELKKAALGRKQTAGTRPKATLSALADQIQEKPAMAEGSVAALVQDAAALSLPPAALLPLAAAASPVTRIRVPPRNAPPRRSRFPWVLAILALMALSALAPFLLLIGTVAIGIPVLVLAILVSLACWKVADVIGIGARSAAPVSGNRKGELLK